MQLENFKNWVNKRGLYGSLWVIIHTTLFIGVPLALLWAFLSSFGYPPMEIEPQVSEVLLDEMREAWDEGIIKIEVENEDGSTSTVMIGQASERGGVDNLDGDVFPELM